MITHEAVRVAIRDARRSLVRLREQADQVARDFNHRGMNNSDGMGRELNRICVEGFLAAGEHAARMVIIAKPAARIQEFREGLSELAAEAKAAVWDGRTADLRDRVAPGLDEQLVAETDHIMSKLNMGVYSASNVASAGDTHNTFTGTFGVVATNGSSVAVGRDLSQQFGPNGRELVELVARLRGELRTSNLPSAEEIDDAAVNLQRELQQEQPSPGRLKRLATAVGDFSVKAGAGAVGGILARIAMLAAGIQ